MMQWLISVKYSKDILAPTKVVFDQDTCSVYDSYNVERISPFSTIIISLPVPTKPQPPPCAFSQLLSYSQPSCPLTASHQRREQMFPTASTIRHPLST